MKASKLKESFETEFGEAIEGIRIEETKAGIADKSNYELWIETEKDYLVDMVEHLDSFQYPHLTVISGVDVGESIKLIYHLSVGYGELYGEVMVNIEFLVDKNDLTVPSLTGLIPGAETSEREKTEFLGVEFEGIPNPSHLFLPDDMDVHPWRKDEEELDDYVKKLDKQP